MIRYRLKKEMEINCPKCGANDIKKNGHRREKQNYSQVGYSKEVKENCLTMYGNGNGFRAIERIIKVNHNTVIRWVKRQEWREKIVD